MAVERGLTRRLGRELLLQAVYISLAVLVGVFVAAQLMDHQVVVGVNVMHENSLLSVGVVVLDLSVKH